MKLRPPTQLDAYPASCAPYAIAAWTHKTLDECTAPIGPDVYFMGVHPTEIHNFISHHLPLRASANLAPRAVNHWLRNACPLTRLPITTRGLALVFDLPKRRRNRRTHLIAFDGWLVTCAQVSDLGIIWLPDYMQLYPRRKLLGYWLLEDQCSPPTP